MTRAERVEQEQRRRELRALREDMHALRCRYGDLADAVSDIVVSLERGQPVAPEALASLQQIYRHSTDEPAQEAG
jgi:hypothetical protein